MQIIVNAGHSFYWHLLEDSNHSDTLFIAIEQLEYMFLTLDISIK